MERHEPPGAEVDQEIGLVRVFFLQKEEVHNAKVTGSLKRLTRGAPAEAREVVQLLRTAWADLPRAARYSVGVASAPPEFSAMRTDRAIAEDYVYGNYLHNDPDRRARIKHRPAPRLTTPDGFVVGRCQVAPVSATAVVALAVLVATSLQVWTTMGDLRENHRRHYGLGGRRGTSGDDRPPHPMVAT